jgi:hypothetical protein
MNPEDISLIKTFQAFCEQAHVRGGSRYVVEHFAINSPNEGGTKAIGKVYFKPEKNSNEVPLEMEWNMAGNALKIGGQFDLIVEAPY